MKSLRKIIGVLAGLVLGSTAAYAKDIVQVWPKIFQNENLGTPEVNGQTPFLNFISSVEEAGCGDKKTVAVDCIYVAIYEKAFQEGHFRDIPIESLKDTPLGQQIMLAYTAKLRDRYPFPADRVTYNDFYGIGVKHGGYTTLPQKEAAAIISTANELSKIDAQVVEAHVSANQMTAEQFEARMATLKTERDEALKKFETRLGSLEKKALADGPYVTGLLKVYPQPEKLLEDVGSGKKAYDTLVAVFGKDPQKALGDMKAAIDQLPKQFNAWLSTPDGKAAVGKTVREELFWPVAITATALLLILFLLLVSRHFIRKWVRKHFVTKKELERPGGDLGSSAEPQENVVRRILKEEGSQMFEDVQKIGDQMKKMFANGAPLTARIDALEKKVENVADQAGTIDIRFADGDEDKLTKLSPEQNEPLTVQVLVEGEAKFTLAIRRAEDGKNFFCLDPEKKIRDHTENTPIASPLVFVRRGYPKGRFSPLEKAYKSPDLAAA